MSGKEFIDCCGDKCRAKTNLVNHDHCPYHKRLFAIYEYANMIQGLEEEDGTDSLKLFNALQHSKCIKKIVKELY